VSWRKGSPELLMLTALVIGERLLKRKLDENSLNAFFRILSPLPFYEVYSNLKISGYLKKNGKFVELTEKGKETYRKYVEEYDRFFSHSFAKEIEKELETYRKFFSLM